MAKRDKKTAGYDIASGCLCMWKIVCSPCYSQRLIFLAMSAGTASLLTRISIVLARK